MFVQTFDAAGEVELGFFLIQLKATDNIRRVADGQELALTLERRDLLRWSKDPALVALIHYDALADAAYWLLPQERAVRQLIETTEGATITVRIPTRNRVDVETIASLQRTKNERVARQTEEG